jgi:hypothetical protein
MRRIIYAIIKADGCWRVVCERRRIGHYDSCEKAALAAIALAKEARQENHSVQVLIQDLAGELWPVARFDAESICDPAQAEAGPAEAQPTA